MAKRELSGSLSRNTRKEKSMHPDYKGSALIGGVEYWISGWRKDGDDGPWVSLAFEKKEPRREESRRQPDRNRRDEDIPF